MASGKDKGQQNVMSFLAWKVSMTDDAFKQITHRGSLNRGEIATACGFGKSALQQNPILKKELTDLEYDLRSRDVLPPLTIAAVKAKETGAPKAYDNTANRRMMDSKRASILEKENIELNAENIELKEKVKELKAKLARFGELSEVLTETGTMPR